MANIAERVQAVRRRMAAVAAAVGRGEDDITLVAVSKRQPLESLFAAYDAGVADFAENVAQDLVTRVEAMQRAGRTPRWHFIGRLQRNKVNAVLEAARVVHTIDRPALAEAVSKRAPAAGLDVYVQVNIGREPQKGGAAPEEAVAFAQQVAQLPGLRLQGLMAIPPRAEDPLRNFNALAALSRALQQTAEGCHAVGLSMGMSHDFETAIRAGATVVRVGTAIFGQRCD